jgi:hypothetical protein
MADSGEIRAWAAAQGMQVGETGKLPGTVRDAYEAAHRDEDEAGPDWAAAAGAVETAEPDDDTPAAPAPPAAPPPEAEPPPPASIKEARERIGPADRARPRRPAWAASSAKSRKPKAEPPPKVTQQVTRDIEGKLALLLSFPASAAAMFDPVCGGALADNLDNVVRKAVPLIAQSPAAVAWFTRGATFMLWLDLAVALQPVAQAAYAHHVAGTVMALPDGTVVPAQRAPDGRLVPAGSVPAAAAAEPDWSAYTTQVNGHVPQPRPV